MQLEMGQLRVVNSARDNSEWGQLRVKPTQLIINQVNINFVIIQVLQHCSRCICIFRLLMANETGAML